MCVSPWLKGLASFTWYSSMELRSHLPKPTPQPSYMLNTWNKIYNLLSELLQRALSISLSHCTLSLWGVLRLSTLLFIAPSTFSNTHNAYYFFFNLWALTRCRKGDVEAPWLPKTAAATHWRDEDPIVFSLGRQKAGKTWWFLFPFRLPKQREAMECLQSKGLAPVSGRRLAVLLFGGGSFISFYFFRGVIVGRYFIKSC